MSKKVLDILPKTESTLDGTNPAPKSAAECEANIIEEFADINAAQEIANSKYFRWLSRLEAKGNKNG